jgi:DNA-binding GntR family transcriptional regulator
MRLPVQINRASPIPLYFQLAEQLSAAINDGTLKPGDPFENELSLTERLGLSRPTVRRAFGELVDQGLLVRRRGIGTIVAKEMVHRRAELTSLYEDLAREGRQPRTDVLSLVADARDDRAATAFGVPATTHLVAMVRVRYAGDTPLAVLRNWLPPQYADITLEQLESNGLYALLRARGVRPTVARQTIGARSAQREDRRLLHLSKAEPLLTMTRSAYDAEGEAVEFGDHCYRAEHYALEVTVQER